MRRRRCPRHPSGACAGGARSSAAPWTWVLQPLRVPRQPVLLVPQRLLPLVACSSDRGPEQNTWPESFPGAIGEKKEKKGGEKDEEEEEEEEEGR